jgi:hypothetical protein
VPRAGDVIDAIEMDEMFKPFVEEFSRFNEQNFSARMKSTLTKDDFELGATCRLDHVSVGTADDASSLATYIFQDLGTWGDSHAFEMDVTDNWKPIPDMTHDFITTGGMFFALANAQFVFDFFSLSGAPLPVMQMAFRVDGRVLLEFANGDFDVNDESPYLQKGQGGWYGASEIEATFPLTSGAHKVEVVVRLPTYGDETDRDLGRKAYLYSRQRFLMEMR